MGTVPPFLSRNGGSPGFSGLTARSSMLPEDWHVSPDLRYALRVGEEVGGISFNRHQGRTVWESLDVLDTSRQGT